jgi:hypothetical protein
MIFDNIENFSILFIFLILMVQYTTRFFHVYRIGKESFTAGSFIFPDISIYYDDIVDVKPFKITDFNIFGGNINFFRTYYQPNRLWGKRVILQIERCGYFKYLVITPDNPEKFIEEINQQIAKAKDEIC